MGVGAGLLPTAAGRLAALPPSTLRPPRALKAAIGQVIGLKADEAIRSASWSGEPSVGLSGGRSRVVRPLLEGRVWTGASVAARFCSPPVFATDNTKRRIASN